MEDMECVRCGTVITPTDTAYAISMAPARHRRNRYRGRPGPLRGWVCLGCATNKKTGPGHDGEHIILNTPEQHAEPAPCAGCRQVVALPVDKRRKHVTCSMRCLIRISPSHNRAVSSPAVTECGQCGGPMPGGRSDARYCSPACRQKAFRRRAAGTDR